MKFNNKKVGKYRSTLEYNVSKKLPKRRGVKIAYEAHKLSYTIPGNYLPDFMVVLPSGRTFYIECKGWLRPDDKRKMVAVKHDNPGIDIRFVFQSKNPKNVAWCEKHGFPWAIKEAPSEWF